MDWKDALQKSGTVLKETVIEYIEQLCQEEVDRKKAMQREEDILCAIMGFVDLKASDMVILGLLQKHYSIDSISERKRYIVDARSFYQCDKLKTHLGLSGIDWVRYKNDHAVLNKLKSNPKLLEMPSEELKAYIEKN